jgi:tRNA G18 (ribose-2'-O)-methylase SpoU
MAAILGAVRRPRQSLIISNISKRNNIKTLLIGAAAFGVEEVLVVGQPKLDLVALAALAFGADDPLPLAMRRFDTLAACRAYVVACGGSICGVEIMHDARDVCTHPFRGDTALLLGNEGTGLSSTQVDVCDHFVFISQHGGGTASLNVSVAAATVMHHFQIWSAAAVPPAAAAAAVVGVAGVGAGAAAVGAAAAGAAKAAAAGAGAGAGAADGRGVVAPSA